MLTLTRGEVRALLAFTGDDRPHLQSVLCDGPAGHVVATDGHMLVVRHSPAFGYERVKVHRDQLLEAARLMRGGCRLGVGPSRLTIWRENGRVAQVVLRDVEHQFPPYLSVLSEPRSETPLHEWAGDPDRFSVAFRALSHVTFGGVVVRSGGRLEAVQLSAWAPNGVEWLALVMPMRSEDFFFERAAAIRRELGGAA